MEDPFFFGISLSTWASFGVALGTLALAFYTYRSVKSSEKQVELANKKFEKPRVVENIQNTINSIQQELDHELQIVNNKDLIWVFPNERDSHYLVPLVFPLSSLKYFYDNFFSILQGPEVQRNKQLSSLIGKISINLKKRHEIYQHIDQNVQHLINEVEQSHFNDRIENLFSKISHFSILSLSQETGKDDILIRDLKTNNNYTKDLVDMIVKSMIISTLFKPLIKDDPRITCLGFPVITTEIFDKIPEFLKNDPIPHSEEIKNSIEMLLNSLKTLDENILEDIGQVKKIYREIYTLKESELNPPQRLW